MRLYWPSAWSTWPARKYKSPSRLAVFQSRGCCLDDRHVLANGSVEPSLAQELLTFFQRVVAIEGHGNSPRAVNAGERRKGDQLILSNSDGGRNDCLWTAE